MFMMDSFREHFLPAHVTVLQTEAKAVWGVIKAAFFSTMYNSKVLQKCIEGDEPVMRSWLDL